MYVSGISKKPLKESYISVNNLEKTNIGMHYQKSFLWKHVKL